MLPLKKSDKKSPYNGSDLAGSNSIFKTLWNIRVESKNLEIFPFDECGHHSTPAVENYTNAEPPAPCLQHNCFSTLSLISINKFQETRQFNSTGIISKICMMPLKKSDKKSPHNGSDRTGPNSIFKTSWNIIVESKKLKIFPFAQCRHRSTPAVENYTNAEPPAPCLQHNCFSTLCLISINKFQFDWDNLDNLYDAG
ncbi:uncharacterized protein LOC122501287 [Leptopilina heterotoma]|uniref:uncharacterized protein LOC122501287 n=1 Tax=Leptopilina heterotoma TaxID=63436 RepID=UPI001CA88BEF|nr:uncharacterized protein LOC122501287 [Leptopilina heterotoma]